MDSDAEEVLLDIIDFCSELMFFARGRDTEREDIERMRYLAIERLIELISEALKQALEAEPALAQDIPNLNRVRGMRNRLAHEYDAIKSDIVWDAVETHVPILVSAVSDILQKRDAR